MNIYYDYDLVYANWNILIGINRSEGAGFEPASRAAARRTDCKSAAIPLCDPSRKRQGVYLFLPLSFLARKMKNGKIVLSPCSRNRNKDVVKRFSSNFFKTIIQSFF